MSILKYLNNTNIISESNTYLYFKCPICDGKVGVQKTGRRAGSYWCYTSNCNTSDIWYKVTGFRSKNVQVFDVEYIPPVNRLEDIKLRIIDKQSYSLPCKKTYYSPLVDTKVTETTYIYDETSIIKRIDYIDEHGKKNKRFTPQYYDDGLWQRGTHYKWLMYNEGYLPLGTPGNAVIVCEGEKTADIITKATGYLTLTPPGFGWNDDYLCAAFNRLFIYVNGIVYLPDNDETGVKKQQLILNNAHKNNLWCEAIKPPESVNDFGDLSEEEISKCLQNYFKKQDQI